MGRVRERSGIGPVYHGQLAKKTATTAVGVCTPISYISRGHLGTSTLNETRLQDGLGTSPNLVSYSSQDLSPFYRTKGLSSQINSRKHQANQAMSVYLLENLGWEVGFF